MRVKVFAAFCLTLLCAVVCAVHVDPASAQGSRRRGGQQPPAAAAPQQPDRAKQVIIGRGSDTQRGSRMTITSDEALNDYSAYRSGDRFYVELPNANAATAARAAGKGFTDMQVTRRGKNVVLSYRVQPGAKPRVEQRFNRLDVVFEVPEGGAARAAQTQTQAPADAAQTPPASNQTAPQPNAARTPASAAATPATNAQQASASQPTAVNPAAPNALENVPTAALPPATAELTPQPPAEQASPAAGQPAAQELAQAQPPAPVAPATTSTAAAGEGSGASLGAFLLRNWTAVLIAALLLTGVGLLIAARRSSGAPPAPAEARERAEVAAPRSGPTAKLEEARQPTSEVEDVTAAASVAAPVAAAAAAMRESSKKSSKKSKKATARAQKEAKAEASARAREAKVEEAAAAPVVAPLAAAHQVAEVQPGPSAAATEVEETAVEESSPAPAAAVEETLEAAPAQADAAAEVTQTTETTEVVAPVAEPAIVVEPTPIAEHAAVAESAAESVAVEPAAESEKVEEVAIAPFVEEKGLDVAAPAGLVGAPAVSGEITPAAAVDPDLAQAEAKRLLEGAVYDRAALSTRDQMARQLIAAELLSALAGRNAERRERARAAFDEFGYFQEKADDLRTAEAAAERSSAARALGLVGDRAATPHLVAALEDDAVEVRRAAVESLANLRDPAAVAPLEQLLRREQKTRDKVNRKLVEHAVEVCRAGRAEAPAAPATEVPAAGLAGTDVAAISATAPAAPDETVTTETPAVEERAVEPVREDEAVTLVAEATPPASAEAAPSLADESPLFGETRTVEAEAPTFEAPEPEPAKLEDEEFETMEAAPSARPSLFAETEAWAESAAPPAAEVDQALSLLEEQAALVGRGPAASVGQEPATPFAEAAAGVREGRTAPADEWIELDMSNLGEAPAAVPPVSETSAGEPAAPAGQLTAEPAAQGPSAFEFTAYDATAIEPAAPAASAEVAIEPVAASARPAEAAIEPFAVTAAPRAEEPRPAASLFGAAESAEAAAAPTFAGAEKGVAPFDEFSSVPANIQQRLASPEPAERAAAVTELARVDNREAFHQVCAAFDDEAREVRAAAARALFDMEGDRADSFTRALREAGPERRRNIGAAIASSGLASEAVGQLTGESREKTYEAFSLLFLMAKAGEVAPLVRAIEGHPNNEVRLAVVKLLALSGQKEVLPAFRRLAVRGSLPTEVRSAVMEAIYQISSQSETTPAA